MSGRTNGHDNNGNRDDRQIRRQVQEMGANRRNPPTFRYGALGRLPNIAAMQARIEGPPAVAEPPAVAGRVLDEPAFDWSTFSSDEEYNHPDFTTHVEYADGQLQVTMSSGLRVDDPNDVNTRTNLINMMRGGYNIGNQQYPSPQEVGHNYLRAAFSNVLTNTEDTYRQILSDPQNNYLRRPRQDSPELRVIPDGVNPNERNVRARTIQAPEPNPPLANPRTRRRVRDAAPQVPPRAAVTLRDSPTHHTPLRDYNFGSEYLNEAQYNTHLGRVQVHLDNNFSRLQRDRDLRGELGLKEDENWINERSDMIKICEIMLVDLCARVKIGDTVEKRASLICEVVLGLPGGQGRNWITQQPLSGTERDGIFDHRQLATKVRNYETNPNAHVRPLSLVPSRTHEGLRYYMWNPPYRPQPQARVVRI